ncbi:hypothetical protein LIER_27198 [Lithospermum erythrorhizon]|uniref:DUF7769 domain-containing protein n=1 Tax=Lithospermum erythrorhizon TaxID=34254 RepID=A0AAV3RCT5_LITER
METKVEDFVNLDQEDVIFQGETMEQEDFINLDEEDVILKEETVEQEDFVNLDEEDVISQGETVEQDGEISTGNFVTFELRRPHQMLSYNQRLMVYNVLLQKSVNGKLKKKHTNEVSDLLKLSLKTVQRIWKQHKNTPPGRQVDVSQKKAKNCGRKKVEIDINLMQQIPLSKRTTMRSIAAALGVQHSKVFRLFKEGLIRRHSNAIKPVLKDENKRARLEFCMSMIDWNNFPLEAKFVAMYNYVHIDEKLFYMTKKSESYYLLPAEKEPVRICQSKNFIGKVMFLVAMARPRFDGNGNEIFSGKIRVFPFITMVPAQRRNRNRDAGTIEMKPITSVTREVVRACLVDEVFPTIRNAWPRENLDEVIYIQQDNARTHVDPSDEQFQVVATLSSLHLQLIYQRPNSPDMNILDLGFFRAIQSLQHKESPKTVEELVQAVVKSFNDTHLER